MNGRNVSIAVGLVLFAVGLWIVMPSGDSRTQPTGDRGGDTTQTTGAKTPRKSILPAKLPGQETPDDERPDEPPRSKWAMAPMPQAPAMTGLELAPSTDADRARQGVTDRFGRGITVTKIHPDAPAAEVALETGDVIVRAEVTNINSVEDLEKAVGTRDSTLVTFARDGTYLQVVLKPPFVPKQQK